MKTYQPKKALMCREGFWHSKSEPKLPKPIKNKEPWKGKKRFLKALSKAENKAAEQQFKGYSSCRICKSSNGKIEYHLGNWVWPEGLRHYIEKHNVRPSLAFQEFIIDEYCDEEGGR